MAPSSFTWLDHRQDDVQRVREALSAFDEQGMQDPLGLGVVRDAFSEMLFPGTSTIHTRARYFLFVPWIYRQLDAEGVAPASGFARARVLEVALIEALLRGSAGADGIIGSVARQTIKQLPSGVYWGGLGRWGIRRFQGTRQDYVATLAERRRRSSRVQDEGEEGSGGPWHPELPPPPEGLYEETRMVLDADEAGFLTDRVLGSTSGTYLAVLVRDGTRTQAAGTPWEHPLAATLVGTQAEQLHHARLFAIASWGAGLLYNAQLSELLVSDGGEALPVDYGGRLEDWLSQVEDHEAEFATWDREAFWESIRSQVPVLSASVKAFVDRWLDIVVTDPGRALHDSDLARRLRDREAAIKGARAKLANRRARERSPGAQGGGLFTYRWPVVSRIVRDIHEGMESDAQPA